MLTLLALLAFSVLSVSAAGQYKKTPVKVETRGGRLYFKLDQVYEIDSFWIDPVLQRKKRQYDPHFYVWNEIKWGFRWPAPGLLRKPRVRTREIRYGDNFPAYETAVPAGELEQGVLYSVEIFLITPGGAEVDSYAKKMFQIDETGRAVMVEKSPLAVSSDYASPMAPSQPVKIQ